MKHVVPRSRRQRRWWQPSSAHIIALVMLSGRRGGELRVLSWVRYGRVRGMGSSMDGAAWGAVVEEPLRWGRLAGVSDCAAQPTYPVRVWRSQLLVENKH
jgi:hypothetical protein